VEHNRPGVLPGPLAAYSGDAGSSFFDMLRRTAPDAIASPLLGPLPAHLANEVPHGTTILALTYPGGVILAADRRATAGNVIARRDMRKVFAADQHSAVAISGSAGPAMEMARVFATELEHYEKVEGEQLSLEGKANKLAFMVRSNLPMAMQGMVVVPLFAGYDVRNDVSAIFEYDPAGGKYRTTTHAATGSGGVYARGTIKRGFMDVANEADAVLLAVAALFDAAEDDSATGGPDKLRENYPIVAVMDRQGYREIDDDSIIVVIDHVLDQRTGA
jgi:proteasome beta subunit